VRPLFFPGGDIGTLAVHGTVNDLVVGGALPLYLTAAFILEEGLALTDLERIVASMRRACDAAGVALVTGDTKVVDRGKADGMYINTSGVGAIADGLSINPSQVRPGDAVIVNGDVGRHGMAIMAVREGLEFESRIESDTAPLAASVQALIDGGVEVHCLRDLTRGGLASGLNEIASVARVQIRVDEAAVPVRPDVAAACEILGLDPLHVANEGRFVAFVPAKDAGRAVELLAATGPAGTAPRIIGSVLAHPEAVVTLRGSFGAERVLDMMSGEQLPRIC
ncbi:MAG: hydrogenase expression/formation protein HypE, partial [Elusimicrobia bacterium]|nr:hydrogenase expression/formation protein HypE [Elusimicrobiota bacterium]